MIEKDLRDRSEMRVNGVWCCLEFFTTICPACGEDTDITITYPDYTEYYHSQGDYCRVYWTKEVAIHDLLVRPGYMRR